MGKDSNSLARISLIAVPLLAGIMGCWLIFTGSFLFHGLALGAAFAIFSLVVILLAWRDMGAFFTPTPKQVACLWRLPWYVLRDSILITITLLKDIAGKRGAGSHFRAVRFEPGDGSHEVERMVLATAANSVAPGTIVLGIARDRLLFHQIKRSPVPQMVRDLRRLGARR